MRRKFLTLMVSTALTLFAVFNLANAAAPKTQLNSMKTSIANAKTLAHTRYSDGTNILVVNWSSRPVLVDIVDLNTTISLEAISDGGVGDNSEYIYSDTYFNNVLIDVYDEYTDQLIASVLADNPSTLEIWDPDQTVASKQGKKLKLKITKKAGL